MVPALTAMMTNQMQKELSSAKNNPILCAFSQIPKIPILPPMHNTKIKAQEPKRSTQGKYKRN